MKLVDKLSLDKTSKSIHDMAANWDHLDIIITMFALRLAMTRIQNGLLRDYSPIYQSCLWSVS